MSARSLLLCLLIVSFPSFAVAEKPVLAYHPCEPTGTYDQRFQSIASAVPWEVWTSLLNNGWSEDALRSSSLFDLKAVSDAMKSVASKTPVSFDSPDETTFSPPLTATPEQTQAYRTASDLYHSENYQAALPAFDAIAQDTASPYRAAAAYSGLRTLFLLKRYQDGAERLATFLATPAFEEFQEPARRLIGTLAYQSGSPELIAAHFVEIKHFLTAPTSMICTNVLLSNILFGSRDDATGSDVRYTADLDWYLASAFDPDAHRQTNTTRRMVIDTLAQNDPFFDLLRALSAPSRFTNDYGWARTEATSFKREDLAPLLLPNGQRKDNPNHVFLLFADSTAITQHARDQATKTKNPLWGFALAKRTDTLSDIALIEEMMASLEKLPQTDAMNAARVSLRSHFILHAARLFLMAGKTDEALAFLKQNPIQSFDTEIAADLRYEQKPERILLNGGLRLLLTRFDLDNARKWAEGMAALFPEISMAPELRPLLAISTEEMIRNKVPGDHPHAEGNPPHAEQEQRISLQIPPSSVLDLYSTSKLRELAKMESLGSEERRLLLGTSLARLYATKGQNEASLLLPQIRESFPELREDIDAIDRAWLPKTKQNLFTHMMLRVPGFGLRPSWARSALAQPNVEFSTPRDRFGIFAIDDRNPNDGNWWCAPKIDETKRDFVTNFFIRPLRLDRSDTPAYREPLFGALPKPHSYENDAAYQTLVLGLANRTIAWHPLLKDVANDELAALSKVENGPKLLSEQALKWEKESSMLSRIVGWERPLAETLHLAVRATRFGCRAEGSLASTSKAAFKALHRDYPWSEWTVKTPYWFDKIGWAADEN